MLYKIKNTYQAWTSLLKDIWRKVIMIDKNINWNTQRLEKQAKSNMQYDENALEYINIDKIKKAQVLDIGCSNGYITYSLFSKYDNNV